MANKYLSKINFEGTEYLIKDAENRAALSNFQDEMDYSLLNLQESLDMFEAVNNIIISAILIKDDILNMGQNMGQFYYSEDFDLPSNTGSNSVTPITGDQLMQLVIGKTSPYLLLWEVAEIDPDTDEIISVNGATIAPIVSHMSVDFDDNSQGKIYCRFNENEIIEIIVNLSSETFTWQKHSITEKIDLAKAETIEELTTTFNNALDTTVDGPSSSTVNHVATFADNTGKAIKDSGFTIASNVPTNAKFTDTIYTLPIANENALGGVKEGGDIAIDSSGIMTVKDDSHNHIVSNIDGLQDKLTAIDNALDTTVNGPSSATANHVAVFTDNTGKSIKDSGFTISKSVPADAEFTDTVYSLPVANTNTLGGVKAGGDVNIGTDGIITIKDDSHNHTIANIDELQNKLNEKAPLDSPTFTGTPKAPDTTNAATNSQIITVNDLTKKINDLVLGAASKKGVDTTPTSNSKNLIESGGVYTSITTLNNQIDTKANKNAGIFYIEGAGTTDTTNKVATWTGTHDDIESYYEGLMIAYKIGTAGSTTTTLNINNLGAITVVKNNTTAISTNFPVNAVIFLVYTLDGTTAYWKAHDYDANTRNSVGDYRKNSTKLYFVGTTSSDSSTSSSYATSYTNSYCYIGTDNCLYAYYPEKKTSERVAFAAELVALQNQIDTKAPLDSPTFTGNPTAPTPSATDNDTSIATTAFVQTAINQVLSASSAMTFKGKINQYEPDDGIDDISYFTLPSRGDVGDTYIVSNSGAIGSHICEIGDLAICIKSYSVLPPVTESDNIDDIWTVVQTNINGAVTGPTSSVDKNVAIFDGITGTVIKDSNLNIDEITSAINEIPALKKHVDAYARNDYVYTTANQALTNKTYNGYTLKDAAGRGVDSIPTINSKNLVESGGLYTKFIEIGNHFDEVEAKTISVSANDDDVVVLSGSGGAYSVSYTASHATQGPTNGYTSSNTTTSITSSGTIKIPQITVNKYGHVTAATDESVTITMPTVPTGFTITPTLTDDNVIDLTGSAKKNGFSLDAKHAKKGPSSGYTSGNSTTSISGYGDSKTIKIPQITVDAYGHVTAAADESVTITMPSAQTLPRTFSVKNTSVAANSWVSSTRNSMYPFQATVNISNLTENYIVSPKYNNMDLIKYIISPETLSNSGNITIYARNKPSTAITIPEINCYQTN